MTGTRKVVLLLLAIPALITGPLAGQERPEARRQRPDRRLEFDRASIGRLMTQRRYGDAIGLLEPLCREHPDRHDLSELLSTCYLRMGRPQEAAALLEDRIKLAPERAALMKNLAAAYLDLDEKDKALRLWEEYLARGDATGAKYAVVAAMQWETGLHDLALETLRRGSAIPEYFEVSHREIVRIERVLGRHEDAFDSAIDMFANSKEPMKSQPRILLETWREAGHRANLLARVDSLASLDTPRGDFFELIAALLRAQAGDFSQASGLISGRAGRERTPEEIYYIGAVLLEMDEHRRSPAYQALYDDLLTLFSGRFARSSVVPRMLLSAARFNMENGDIAAEEGGGRRASEAVQYYQRALSLADSASRHPGGRSFSGAADLLRATLLVERLYRPSAAMKMLSGKVWRANNEALEAGRLRLKASLATAGWDEAESWLLTLEASGDSVLKGLGTYGRGMIELYRGDYDEATGLLSSMAKEYPGSEWANDALSWALVARMAKAGEEIPLKTFIDALRRGSNGDFGGAVAALERLTVDHPASLLLSRALWEKGRLLEHSGRLVEALETFSRISQEYPEDVYAPRALEKVGDIKTGRSGRDGAEDYARLIEEYPRYPFISRVRTKYLSLSPQGQPEDREEAGS